MPGVELLTLQTFAIRNFNITLMKLELKLESKMRIPYNAVIFIWMENLLQELVAQ